MAKQKKRIFNLDGKEASLGIYPTKYVADKVYASNKDVAAKWQNPEWFGFPLNFIFTFHELPDSEERQIVLKMDKEQVKAFRKQLFKYLKEFDD